NEEALPHPATDEEAALRGAVADHVAGDDVELRREDAVPVGAHDHAPAREPLADVVIAVTLEADRDAGGQEGAEGLPRRPAQVDVDRVLRQPVLTMGLRDVMAEHRAD